MHVKYLGSELYKVTVLAAVDRSYTSSYQSATVTIALSCIVFPLFDVEYYDLEN